MNFGNIASAKPQSQASAVQAFRDRGKVIREFTAEQASESIELRFPMNEDRKALLSAQLAIQNARVSLESSKLSDDTAADSDKTPGSVTILKKDEVWYDECNQGQKFSELKADLAPGAESLDERASTTGPFGSQQTAAYYRNASDFEMVGYAIQNDANKGLNAVEVLVSPSGALTVFTDQSFRGFA